MSVAGAIRAGLAYVEIFADDKRLKAGLAGVTGMLKSFSKSVAAIGAATAAAGLAIEGGLALAVRSFVETGDELEKMSIRTGLTVESLSLLGYAAGQSDASLQDIQASAKHMARFMLEAASGSKEAADTLETLGMRFEDIRKIHPDELFQQFGKAVSQLPLNTFERNAIAMKVFGRNGLALIPMFKEIDSLIAEGGKLRLGISAQDARNAVELGDAWDRVVKSFKAGVFAIGAALAPDLKVALDVTLAVATGVLKWVQENRELVKTLALISGGLVAIGTAAVGVAAAVAVISVGISSGILPGIALAAAFWGAIATATYVIFKNSTYLQNLWANIAAGFGPAWDGIVKAVKAGELQLAFEILTTQLQLTWVQKLGWLERRWARASATIQNLWGDMATELRDAWDILVYGMGKLFGGFADFVTGQITELTGKVVGLLKIMAALGGVGAAAAKAALDVIAEDAPARQKRFSTIAGAIDPALQKQIDERNAKNAADKAAREKGVKGLTYEQLIREDKLEQGLAGLLDRANALKPSDRIKGVAPDVEDFTDKGKLGALGTFSGVAASGLFGTTTDLILTENRKQSELLQQIRDKPGLTFG